MSFRIEMDAFIAIYEETKRTNELLENIIKLQPPKETAMPITDKIHKRNYTRRKAQ